MLIASRNGFAVKFPITAKNYVQSGLVAMWDGIENAGWGRYDANATTWKNLAGDSAWDLSVPATWVEDGITMDGTWCGIAPKTSLAQLTIEVVSGGVGSGQRLVAGWSLAAQGKRPTIDASGIYSAFRAFVNNAIVGTWPAAAALRSIAATFGADTRLYAGGSVNTVNAATLASGTTRNHFRLGGYGSAKDTDATDAYYIGTVHCCRVYSRALTASEIAANYAVDKIRFNLP